MNINKQFLLIALFNTSFVFSADQSNDQSNENIEKQKRRIKNTSHALMVSGMGLGLFGAVNLKESSPEMAAGIALTGMGVAVASHAIGTIIENKLEKQRRNS